MVVSDLLSGLNVIAEAVDPQVLASYQKSSMPSLLDYAGYYTIRYVYKTEARLLQMLTPADGHSSRHLLPCMDLCRTRHVFRRLYQIPVSWDLSSSESFWVMWSKF